MGCAVSFTPGRFISGKRSSSTRWLRSWVTPRTAERCPCTRIRPQFFSMVTEKQHYVTKHAVLCSCVTETGERYSTHWPTDRILMVCLRGPQIFQISRSYRQILGSGKVTWSKFLTEDPQIWSDLKTLTVIWRFLLGACDLIQIFARKWKTVIIMLKI
jgi:hypothetical protein